MEVYQVKITEVLSRIITVKTDTMEDALYAAKEMYRKEKVVLDAEDLKDVSYEIVPDNNDL